MRSLCGLTAIAVVFSLFVGSALAEEDRDEANRPGPRCRSGGPEAMRGPRPDDIERRVHEIVEREIHEMMERHLDRMIEHAMREAAHDLGAWRGGPPEGFAFEPLGQGGRGPLAGPRSRGFQPDDPSLRRRGQGSRRPSPQDRGAGRRQGRGGPPQRGFGGRGGPGLFGRLDADRDGKLQVEEIDRLVNMLNRLKEQAADEPITMERWSQMAENQGFSAGRHHDRPKRQRERDVDATPPKQ